MADINLNINILDNAGFPTLSLIDTTDLSITVNDGTPTLADNSITELIPQDTTVTIVVDKTGYDSYVNSVDVTDVDKTIYISLSETVVLDFLNIAEDCHSFVITNNGTTEDDNVTYTITNLDGVAITDYEDIVLDYGTSKTFTSTADNIYIWVVKDAEGDIIRNYIIIDYCDIRQCISNRILNILCDCDCKAGDCQESNCKKDFEMKRIFLLQFDIFSRINQEYRLNSYYSTIDDLQVQELKTAQEEMDKLNKYCSTCGDTTISNDGTLSYTTTKSPCGCS